MSDNSVGKTREQFNSKMGFVLAAAGAAVGLGNLWKFPYMVGKHGGGAFVLIYLIFIFIIGSSALTISLMLGRRARTNAVEAYGQINSKLKFFGYMAIIATILLTAFYSIIGGWTIFYLVKAITGNLIGLPPDQLGGMLHGFFSSTSQLMIYQVLFLVLTAFIVVKGISGGIEKACKFLMPALFVMMIILAIRAITLPGAWQGVVWYLKPDFSEINSSVVINALGQAFFSLSVGAGGMVTYGSYLSKKENIQKTALTVTIADTSVAILAGLITIPAVFAFGMDPGEGPGLVFVTLPHVFSQMPLGFLFAVIFFVLLLVAAITSSIAMVETVVTFGVEKIKIARNKLTWFVTGGIFIIGIPPLLSFGPWKDVLFRGKNWFDIYDYFVSNLTLTLVALVGTIIVGYLWKKEDYLDEITSGGEVVNKYKEVWYKFIRYILPLFLIILYAQMLGLIKF